MFKINNNQAQRKEKYYKIQKNGFYNLLSLREVVLSAFYSINLIPFHVSIAHVKFSSSSKYKPINIS